MSVHYKFKSSLDFDTVTFDGLHISVNDFRKAVVQQKRLGKTNDFELQITNAQTKEVYENDNDLIPKNTSLIISRIPQTSKKPRDNQTQNAPTVCHVPKFDSNTLDLSQMNASEEDKIQAMMAQSTVDYDPRGYQKIRGPGQTGEVPPTYRCYKCHQTGHWIKNCPLPHSSVKKSDIRRNTGIPKSFLQDKDVEKDDSAAEEIVIVQKQAEVPDELLCSICKDIFRDAVMIPCCGSSFCDDCVRTALVDSEENECPDCKEKGTSPGSLIPNRFLRSSVNTFKNETGYERRRKNNGVQEVPTTSAPVEVVTTSEEPAPKEEPAAEKQEQKASVSPEKELPESVPKTSDGESTPPKLSPKKEEPVPVVKKEEKKEKKEIESTKQEDEDKQEHRRRRSRERDSPRRHPEVVIPQHEPSHNSDIQARPDDTFSQNNPQPFSNYGPMVHDMPHRSNTTDSYPVRSDSYMRHAKPNQGVGPPHMGYMNNYGNRNERYCYPRDSYNMNSAPYPYMQNQRYRQMAPHSNIPPYYQGMAGEIGPGIIEDPLDAFNRIMKEKEKRKEMKRLASERHRSMGTKSRGPRDQSPIVEKRSRHRVSPLNDRRNRSPLRQEKISSHRNIERDKNARGHRGHYPSNKRSFSRSNSPPPQRRYSKSPIRRRSRSRSHPRSHSRDMELLRQHDSRVPKHIVQQMHRSEYDREVQRYNKKSSGRFSETRSVSEAGPKENRRHNSKMRENGNQMFEPYPSTHQGSRKAFIETDNMPEFRDMQHEFHEKKRRTSLSRSEEGGKIVKKRDNGEGRHNVQPVAVEPVKHEVEKKSKERKKKKDKDDKSEKKSKKDKKEKKKRERHKDDHKKHSEHKKSRKEPESMGEATNVKEDDDVNKNSSDSRKGSSKFANEESLDDRQETFTPDINITRHLEADDQIMDEQQKEGDSIPSEDNFSKMEKSPVLFKDDRYKQIADNTCSELNTPTSFVDTTPENYAGKWDNFDFSMPNSEEIRGENERDSEYDSHLLQLSRSPPMRTDHFEPSRHLGKKKDVFSRLQPRNEDMMFKEKRSDPATKATPPRRPSPTPSEAKSSSSNVSKSHSKKRRKKSKHKKDHKRSSSAESSKNSRAKSVSKHKKSRSEKKKKTKRNESR